MGHIDTLIVSDNSVLRESLLALLTGTRFTARPVASSVALHLCDLQNVRMALVVIDEEATSIIRQLAEALPNVKIVALALRDTEGLMMCSLQLGASAYLKEDILPANLLKILEVVAAGWAVLPASFLGRSCIGVGHVHMPEQPNALVRLRRADGTTLSRLSSREVSILERLALGEPNKAIARNLNLAEATVKVLVKTVLRKARVKNRTQAAVWAMSRGIVRHGPVPTERLSGLVQFPPKAAEKTRFASGVMAHV
ncbi:response regulator transcription factor [Methylorubrum extorquens]|uniref:response regulator transcription factor n=1 Tax=Methylorubrum extorquens TaxID=408 RepID=UPI000158F52A|nr:response regulator transcription factor [Methylorubrum extorquens]ABY31956.1 regulatory protein LuxR [Methylorubrum extorquens PA1]KQP93889.1 LuxR family transcriptional regulator [Methylobacterium sp. Leaf119]WIU38564.1 response regulator transcription factor [Methylorubrum extorquens]